MVKICTKCKVEKPLADFRRDSRKKSGVQSSCKECEAEHAKKYREANPEKARESVRKYHEANPEKKRELNRKYYEANPEKVQERGRAWKKANPERDREHGRKYYEANPEKVRESVRKYKKANPEKKQALDAKRRATKLRATPAWANLKAIEAIYAESIWLTQCLGIEHHVDHIIPLQGKKVCGLHVHSNLQILSAKDNLSKGNRYGT